MHALIEKARKSAGIASLKKNYPDDPKQRGCGFWAAFLGSLDTSLGQIDEENKSELKTGSTRLADALTKIAELEHMLNKLRKLNLANGVTRVGLQEGWTKDKQQKTLEEIAG